MLPSAYPYDDKELKMAWREFIEEDRLTRVAVDPIIVRSWRSCREAGLDPSSPAWPHCCSEEVLEQRRQDCFNLIALARPFMEDVYQFSGESDMIVYLTDAELYVVEWLGDSALVQVLVGMHFDDGVQLSDEVIGTNAAAMALSEGIPVQVVGAEHFCEAYHRFTGAAAPIHAPTGQVMGVGGVITLEQNSHPHTLGVVMAAARAIENQLQAELSLSEAHQHLSELNASLQAMSKGIVFLTPRGIVTHMNASAGEILDVSHRLARGRRLRTIVEFPPELEIAIAQQDPMREKEVVFQYGEENRPCLVSLDVLREGERLLGFILTLSREAEARRLVYQMVGAQAHFTFDDILGQDVNMRRVLHYARAMARSESPVLLLGESGTGKEMFAQAIHNASRYADGPFIAINCAAIPRKLMASELFGYEGMLSNGEEEGRPGKFELADQGTIFFDNIDSMPLDIQASILRVIDTKKIIRLGGTRVIPLELRITAASNNLDLAQEVKQGRFRDDLFYRLHALTLKIPALRDRGNDILLLIAHLIEKYSQRLSKKVTVSPQAMAVLQSYHWPGNVREMENVLECAMHMVEGPMLEVEHLPHELLKATIGGDEKVLSLEEAERQAIIRAGRAFQGKTTEMAEALGIGRTTLWRKMNAFDLSTNAFTDPNA